MREFIGIFGQMIFVVMLTIYLVFLFCNHKMIEFLGIYQALIYKSHHITEPRKLLLLRQIFSFWRIVHPGYLTRDALKVTSLKISMHPCTMLAPSLTKGSTLHCWRIILIGGLQILLPRRKLRKIFFNQFLK